MRVALTPALVTALLLAVAFRCIVDTAGPKFRSDDPLAREPDSQDAAGVKESDIGLVYNLGYNLFVTASRRPEHVRALNVNTIDEVPDSSWFTNRIGAKPMTAADIVWQSTPGPPPARWRRAGSPARRRYQGRCQE